MKTLVVHDREEVREQIVSCLREVCPDGAVDFCEDGSTARKYLTTDYYDLLVLDLTIPMVVKNGNVGLAVAEGILEELIGSSNLITPGNTLGITVDPEALLRISNNIGPHLMAIVDQSDEGNWLRLLRDRVLYVQNSVRSRSNVFLKQFDNDALIVTALDKELTPFRDIYQFTPHDSVEGVETFQFQDRHSALRRVACYAIGRAGQPSASSDTQGLICLLRPKLAIMSGFCGGVPGKADLGDILFAESVLDWDYGKWKPDEEISQLHSRPEPIGVRNSPVHRIARRFAEHGIPDKAGLNAQMALLTKGEITAPVARLAPFASGSSVIGDPNILASIKQLNDAVGGVDMESFGFYYACRHSWAVAPNFICVKSVADACDVEKDDRLHQACCYASAHCVVKILEEWDFR